MATLYTAANKAFYFLFVL